MRKSDLNPPNRSVTHIFTLTDPSHRTSIRPTHCPTHTTTALWRNETDSLCFNPYTHSHILPEYSRPGPHSLRFPFLPYVFAVLSQTSPPTKLPHLFTPLSTSYTYTEIVLSILSKSTTLPTPLSVLRTYPKLVPFIPPKPYIFLTLLISLSTLHTPSKLASLHSLRIHHHPPPFR